MGTPAPGRRCFIPDALYPARIGTTDLEAIFLAILGAGADEAPVAAVKHILLKLKRMVDEGEDEDQLPLYTAALTDGNAIYAFP